MKDAQDADVDKLGKLFFTNPKLKKTQIVIKTIFTKTSSESCFERSVERDRRRETSWSS